MKNKMVSFILVGFLLVGVTPQVLGYEGYQGANQKSKVTTDVTLEVANTRQVSIFSAIVPLTVAGEAPMIIEQNPNRLVSAKDLEGKFDLVMDSNAVKITESESTCSIVERLNQQVRDSMITTSITTRPIFINGKSTAVINIKNVETNKYSQKIEIRLTGTDEVIYVSPILNVGGSIEQIKLSKSLDKGVYPCTAYFINMKNGEAVGEAGVDIVLEIEN